MAIPAGTKVFAESMDPYDVVDFEVDLVNLLESGEAFTNVTVSLPAESDLLGLTLGSGPYAESITGTILKIWLSIDAQDQGKQVFDAGVTLPIEIRVTTNSSPARKKQRTVAVQVVNR